MATQQAILEECWDWATHLGRGVARHSTVEADVIHQLAGLAVCKALARYDPRLGDFESYARATTAGEIRHYLRSAVWPVHVPRSLQEQYRLVAIARDDLTQRLGQEPSSDLVAEAVHISVTDAAAAIGLRRGSLPLDSDDHHLPDGDRDLDLDSTPARVDLGRAIEKLSAADQRLLELRFYQGFTQPEIAEILGTNQVKVSRMLTKTLLTLRRLLEAQP
jgi:RNA polymerase sigma-B factor